MKNNIIKSIVISVLGSFLMISELHSQYTYGMEICDQDIRIDGRINVDVDTNSVYIGFQSGVNIVSTEAKNNTAIGYQSGKGITSGLNNTFIGASTGNMHATDSHNTYVGSLAGSTMQSGISNTIIGSWSGRNKISGSGNTFIGQFSGQNNYNGSRNIFIGQGAGSNETGSNKLVIDNSSGSEPLVYGEFDNDLIRINGSLHVTDFAKLKPRSDSPIDPEVGTIYYDSNDNKVKVWTGNVWENLN